MNPAHASYGCQSMVAPLRRVLVRRPGPEFASADPETWHYASRPDLPAARAEHEALVAILREAGSEVHFHEVEMPHHADAIFVHDPALVTGRGAIILRMGKALRRGEETAMAAALEAHGVPILARLDGDATAEGGDLLWLDEHTLVVGLGFRTNLEGLHQLARILEPSGVTTLGVDLPYHSGPHACLHLMSCISLLDHDLAVVYPPLMPVRLWQELKARGIRMVEVPEAELHTMGPNVLALAPRHCLMLEDNTITRSRLEESGCEVVTYRGQEISLKAEGAATCLTRPVLRSDS
jgi:N-dimethylarginine dimethylaminohydrolase